MHVRMILEEACRAPVVPLPWVQPLWVQPLSCGLLVLQPSPSLSEGHCLPSKEPPTKVPRACGLAGRGNIKPVWKSNSRVRTEGRKGKNTGNET